MKYFRVSILATLLTYAVPAVAAIEWHTDYAKVKEQSREENKPILVFFNGSDWSGWAMKMKHEVLDAPLFQEKIASAMVCMEADFPEHSALPLTQVAQNLELKKRYGVQEVPLLLLLDTQERVIAQIGYVPESGNQLAEDLLLLFEQDVRLMAGLNNLNVSPSALKELYSLAQELSRPLAVEQILDAGLKTEDPYFFLEKYRLQVLAGEMKSKETLALREKLMALDPDNQQEVHFTLALIDFQELSQHNAAPDTAVQPLVDYLCRFGATDSENVWRIEMMMAQHYMDAEIKDKALIHAERALQAAPVAMRPEITHSLDYIRSKTTR